MLCYIEESIPQATGLLADPRRFDFSIYRGQVGLFFPRSTGHPSLWQSRDYHPASIMFSSKKLTGGQDILALMNCRRLPARLTTGETAAILGFQEHDVAPLVAAKLLMPLGKPAPNAPKYFASVDILGAAEDREWLSQATKALSKHWHDKNVRKKGSRLSTFQEAA